MTDIINRQVIGDGATWMCSAQYGAPQMSSAGNANGQMLQVLDAVLVDGFNLQTSTGAELLPDGYIKIKFGTAVDYRLRQKLLISGANDENLNGEHIITKVVGNDVVIKAPDVNVLTGVIKTKVASLGWESIFGTTHPLKRAYRSKNPRSTQTVLYLDMTLPTGHGYDATRPAHRAMVTICDDMTEIGVPINSYTDTVNNYATNVNGSLFWYQARGYNKSSALSNIIDNDWTIVGNSDYFYFMPSWINLKSSTYFIENKGYNDFYCFGDFPSLAGETDAWSCAWAGANFANDVGGSTFGSNNGANVGDYYNKYFISGYSGVGEMLPFYFKDGGSGSYFSGAITGISYPNPTTQSMICQSLYTVSDSAVRSYVPRLMAIQHRLGGGYANKSNSFVDDVLIVALSGSKASSEANTVNGYFAFDMGD